MDVDSPAGRRGIPCPRCGASASRVSYRTALDGQYSRRRRCKDCGEFFTTVERIIGQVKIPDSIYGVPGREIPSPADFLDSQRGAG